MAFSAEDGIVAAAPPGGRMQHRPLPGATRPLSPNKCAAAGDRRDVMWATRLLPDI